MKEKEKSLFDIFNRTLVKATKDIIDAVEKSNRVDKDAVANDRFKQHEILDRVYLIQDMFSRYVEGSEDVVQADPKFTAAAAKVSNALGEFYQLLGQRFI
jgi:hypothetical protein